MKSRDAETEGQSQYRWSRVYAPASLFSAVVLAAVLAIVLATAIFTTAISRADGPPDLGDAFTLPFKLEQGRPAPARASSGPRQVQTPAAPTPALTPAPTPGATPGATPGVTPGPTPSPAAELAAEPTPRPTPVPGALHVAVSASPSSPAVNQATQLSAVISNPPEGESPSYSWEVETGGAWSSFGRQATWSFMADRLESWTFRLTVSYGNGDSATSDPLTVTWVNPNNRAPVVDTEAENYAWFVGDINAAPGVLVSKPLYQVFSDPDGDKLTYAVSITSGNGHLVKELDLRLPDDPNRPKITSVGIFPRLFLIAGDDAEWKALSPPIADPEPVTVRVTATDLGGLSVSLESDYLVHWDSYPEVVSAKASGKAIKVTFDVAVEDDPAPTAGQFTVNVANTDGTTGTIAVNSVSVKEKVVTLALASAPQPGQTVTLDYANDYDTPLKRAIGGSPSLGFTGLAVDLALLNPPGAPENFAVSVQRGQLALLATGDAVEGATSYKLRWRQVGGEFEAANATTVSDTTTTITVSGYGEWEVRLQGCNDNGCSPEAGDSEDEVPVLRLSLEPAPEAGGQSRARSVTPTRNPAADGNSYTAGWGPAGAQSQPDASRQTRGLDGPSDAVGSRSADTTDTTPPRLVRGEIDGDTMTFYFNEALDENATGSRFRVTLYFRNGWTNFTAHPSRVEVSGNQVTVHGLSQRGWPGYERALVGRSVQAYYYKDDRVVPAGQRLRDLAGNEVLTRHSSPGGYFPATRTIWLRNLTALPTLQSATAHLDRLTLTFDETLDGNSVPAAGAFTVSVNRSTVSLASVDPVAVSGDTVTLVLASPVESTDAVTVSYAKPSERPLRDPDGAVESFSSATNLVGVTPTVSAVKLSSDAGADRTYTIGETIRVTLTFGAAVDVDTTGGRPRLKIKLDPAHGERLADYTEGSGTSQLVFAYTVAEPDRSTRGVAVLGNTLELNGGAIRSISTQRDVPLGHAGQDHDPDHTVDWQQREIGAPWVTGVAITSDPGADHIYGLDETVQVTATFNEAVNVTGAPRLKIKMAPTYRERLANYDSGSGTTELVFSYPVVAGNLSYRGVAVLGGTLELNGGTIRSTAATPVNAYLWHSGLGHNPEHRVDGAGPSLVGVSVNGTKVSVSYNESLDADSLPPASAFTVKRTPQGGSEETVGLSGSPAIAGGAVLLTLASAVAATDTAVKVSYTRPTAAGVSKLKDAFGNEATSFTDRAADATDTTPPRPVRGEIDGGKVTIYFSEPLDDAYESYGPPAVNENHFRVYLRFGRFPGIPPKYIQCETIPFTISFRATPQEVTIDGNRVELIEIGHGHGNRRLRASVGLETPYVFFSVYSDSHAKTLRDLAGNAASEAEVTLDNVTHLPSPERATVDGARLTLTFSAPMDGGRVPAADAFTVKVNGSEVSLAGSNPVSVLGREVTLTLAAAVASGDAVTVNYEIPESNFLQNVICEYAPSFNDQDVTNNTPPWEATLTAGPSGQSGNGCRTGSDTLCSSALSAASFTVGTTTYQVNILAAGVDSGTSLGFVELELDQEIPTTWTLHVGSNDGLAVSSATRSNGNKNARWHPVNWGIGNGDVLTVSLKEQ
ncbi:MAG: hypothetical protein F4X65_13730 [Chloroflexi bacterium]|nr:hypothetical protein [Chloroflexota bacterium]